jgi:hypothetical protein
MSTYTALLFVHECRTGKTRDRIYDIIRGKASRMVVASDVVEDLDARREALDKEQGWRLPRWSLVDFSPAAFWDGIFGLAGGSCRAWIFESPANWRKEREPRGDQLRRLGVRHMAVGPDINVPRTPIVWTTSDLGALAELGIEHASFEFGFGCVFAGNVGELEREMEGSFGSWESMHWPGTWGECKDVEFIERAMEECSACLIPHGAHRNEDVAIASWKHDAAEVAGAMAKAAAAHGIEARILTCTYRDYWLWSHETKLQECECEVFPPTGDSPGGPVRPSY